mmetsp:Transcript_17738/g.43030  ORF Transcript_17738/g.43030 Transcript_17738/m.43030 type:complete len:276 (+) Transcript_17738:273-1100(+)
MASSNFIQSYGKYAPTFTLVCGLITLFGTLFLARANNHLPDGLWLPMISFTSAQPPEQYLYATGFTLTASGIVLSALFANAHFLPLVENEHACLATTCFWAAIVAAGGLVWQAVIPIQANVKEVIEGSASIDLQSQVHQLGAVILFLAGYTHCVCMDLLLWRSKSLPAPLFSKRLKLFLTVTMLAPFATAMIRHPASAVERKINLEALSWGAVGQWTMVGSLLLFVTSYQFEFNQSEVASSTHGLVSSPAGAEGESENPNDNLLRRRAQSHDDDA